MNLLSSLVLFGSLALTLGCSGPDPGATNIARNGEASQDSTVADDTIASNAIDGNTNPYVASQSCSMTSGLYNPWWKVDLKQTYKISHVVLTNLRDCCQELLLGAEVRIGNNPDNNNPVCGTVTNIESVTLPFCCNGMEGQFVSVVIPGRYEVLTLCEVEVYEEPVTVAPPENKVCW
ncbi:fucolectin-6-like [Bufo bufo]|uniref:fucolectin-6-like n=1 Tax=Bufo bufo TaxID=8384 RepID=UPI001ABDEABE|nr:fucolectin-6-like [Bufo bufo]XP_040288693.1 fucolectin-6-like [Bufo bufo]